MQGGVGIDEVRRSGRSPSGDVALLPADSCKLSTGFGEHFRRGIDAYHLGIGERVGQDASQMASAAAEIVDCRVFDLGDAGDEIKAGAKADVGVAKVSLRLPSSHSVREIIALQVAQVPDTGSNEEALRAIELHHLQAVFGADFVLHAIEVILDGLLGERKMIGDFLVGETLRNQRYQLQLAAA